MEKLIINISKIFAVLCLVFLLMAKIHPLSRPFLNDNDLPPEGKIYSDLYSMCKITAFKEDISANVPREKTGNINDADILIIGDSFLENHIEGITFEQALQKRTQLKVTDITRMIPDAVNTPLFYINQLSPDTTKVRYLILDSVERLSLKRIKNYPIEKHNTYSLTRYYESFTEDYLLYNDVNYFVRFNYMFRDFLNYKSNFNFNYFNQILNKEIGAFSVNPNFLFYNEEVVFDKRIKSEQEINEFVESVAAFSKDLEKYKIKIIYVIIPNKYSIYNEFINGKYQYDDYIPRVYSKLKDKNITTIDIISIFQNRRYEDGWLYYHSDTHFNEKGRDIMADECLKTVNEQRNNKPFITSGSK